MNVDRIRAGRHPARTRALVLMLAVMTPTLARAQQPAAGSRPQPAQALTLDEAIRLAARESEALQIARAGVTRASGTQRQARSQYLPQVNSSLAYARTL